MAATLRKNGTSAKPHATFLAAQHYKIVTLPGVEAGKCMKLRHDTVYKPNFASQSRARPKIQRFDSNHWMLLSIGFGLLNRQREGPYG
jgi:hypothetical protein